MRVLLGATLAALALFGPATDAGAQEIRALPPPQPVPLDTVVHVGALPPPPASGPHTAAGTGAKPFLTPDPAGLAAAKQAAGVSAPGVVLDAAPRGAGGEGPRAPAVIRQFDGLANANQGFAAVPPDHNLAVGPTQVFEMVNITGRIFTKTGFTINTFTLNNFFGVTAGFGESDPHVLFDAASNRWFGVYLEFDDTAGVSSLILVVSQTTDASGTFCRYRLGFPTQETFLQDFPMLGVSGDKVVVSYNAFGFPLTPSSPLLGAGYYVVRKSDLLACAGSLTVHRVPPDPTRDTSWPSQAQGSPGTNSVFLAMNATSTLKVFTLTGVPGVSVVESTLTLPIRLWSNPPDAPQGGSGVLLQTNDNRVLSVAWQGSSLWVTGNEGCVPAGDSATRSCLRVIEVRTDTSALRQDMTFAGVGQYYYFPAARPDASDNLNLVFTASSATVFAGVRVTGRLATDPLNTLQASTLIKAGGGAQTAAAPSNRMGDYAGAALDPSDPTKIWVVGQYIRATATADWGTWIAQVQAAAAPPPVFLGGVFVAAGRIDGTAGAEVITGPDSGAGPGPLVKIFKSNGTPVGSFLAFLSGFTGGVRVAACDFDGDGRDEIVVGAGPGGGPHVRVLKVDTAGTPTLELVSIFPYPVGFTGGAFVACGNVEGTPGTMNLVTGAGSGGGPHVRILRYDPAAAGGVTPVLDYFPFDPGFVGGVRVAAGDVDGDGRAEVITAAGTGGGSHVRAFTLVSGSLVELTGFFAYGAGFTGGVFVAAGDVTGSATAEIVTGAGTGGGPHVRAFTGTGADAGVSLFAYDPGFTGGVRVAVGDVDATGVGEIVTGPGPGAGADVRVFTPTGTLVGSFLAY